MWANLQWDQPQTLSQSNPQHLENISPGSFASDVEARSDATHDTRAFKQPSCKRKEKKYNLFSCLAR